MTTVQAPPAGEAEHLEAAGEQPRVLSRESSLEDLYAAAKAGPGYVVLGYAEDEEAARPRNTPIIRRVVARVSRRPRQHHRAQATATRAGPADDSSRPLAALDAVKARVAAEWQQA